MMKKEWIGGACSIGLILLIAVLFSPVVAAAQFLVIDYTVSGSPPVSGFITTDLDWDVILQYPGEDYYWNAQEQEDWEPVEITLQGGDTAYIDGVDIGIKLAGDPYIDFGFAARASKVNPTHFLFTSALLPIDPALINLWGSAWATPSPGGSAVIQAGDFTDNKIFHTVYNGGTLFADLGPAPMPPVPPGGYNAPSQLIPGQVTSMQSMWGFTLSAGGQASGTSNFTILGDTIPEPASMLLLGLGGLALIRKRRV